MNRRGDMGVRAPSFPHQRESRVTGQVTRRGAGMGGVSFRAEPRNLLGVCPPLPLGEGLGVRVGGCRRGIRREPCDTTPLPP